MFLLAFILPFALSLKDFKILIVSSNKTSPLLSEAISDLGTLEKIDFHQESNILASSNVDNFSIIFDITKDKSYISTLDSYSLYKNTPYISLSIPTKTSWYEGRYALQSSLIDQLQKIIMLLEVLGWNEFGILHSSKQQDIELCNLIKNQDKKKIISIITYQEEISFKNADNIIKTMVKAKGLSKLLIIDSGFSVAIIQNAIISRNLIKEENYFIFVTEDIKKIVIEGALIISTQGQENSNCFEDYIKGIFENIIEKTIGNSQESSFSDVFEIIKRIYPENIIKEYSLVNVWDGKWIEVGKWGEKFEKLNEIVYPGGISYVAQGHKVMSIRFSIANGTEELTTDEVFNNAAIQYIGAVYAVYRSNILNEIPNFSIELFPTNCGNMYFDINLSKECFRPILDKLGVVYLTSCWGPGALGNALALKAHNHYIPQISPTAQYEELGNQLIFPEFLKLTVSIIENISTALYLIKSFNWNSAIVFISDNPIHYILYSYLIAYLEEIKFGVVNSVDKRIFPGNYTRDDFEKYRSFFEEAKNSRCRIFIIHAKCFSHILEGLYDVGIRRGDAIIISGDITVIDTINENIEKQYYVKREEFIRESFVYSYKEWNGEYGQQIFNEISKKYQVLPKMCMTFDAVTVAKESIKYLIDTGNDYEDLKLVSNTMRNSRTNGCLGSIFFDRNSNSIESAAFKFQKIIKNKTLDKWVYQDWIAVDKYSQNTIIVLADIVWPTKDGSSPSTFKPKQTCPFDQSLSKFSSTGLIPLWCLSITILIVMIISSYKAYKKLDSKINPLIQEKTPTISDFIFISNLYFWFFQFLSLSPKNTYFDNIFKDILALLSLNFMNFLDKNSYNFWVSICIAKGFCIFWTVICVLVSNNLHFIFIKYLSCDKILDLSPKLLPYFADLSLIPILTILLQLFICKESIGNNLTDSFLNNDCTKFCYETYHLKMAIGTAITIIFFIISITLYRIMWEKSQISLNLETNSLYLSFLSFIQVSVVVIKINLEIYSEIYAGISVCVCILVLLLIGLKINAFNYNRLNKIWNMLLMISLCHCIISTLFLKINSFLFWTVCECLSIGSVLLIGSFYIKKAPCLLKSEKNVKISKLFLFQFGKVEQKYAFEDSEIRMNSYSIRNSSFRLR
ncbi:hypothetical protein SteCoe_11760 [Stentor coeruleus]|uniref:Receptor ligand binding region domain-containing protein n=1 Tax=Stentor coeruleus TaxID=5963 RepID=A0A1R2CCG1_9CILI|nr:hypothetical protein SteCoe_11760 [Stentor coeruleus]